MIGIVIVTHGKLAEAFVSVTEHVVGKQTQLKAIGIEPEDDAEKARERILDGIKEVDSGKGVIILTDMFGGTPSNLAISVMKRDGVEVIAGVNLPMMIKLASVRAKVPMEEAVAQAQEAARKYINIAGNLLAAKVDAMPSATVEIINKKGLHARAAAKFVKIVAAYEAEVLVTKQRCSSEGEQAVGGASILGLMMLGADPGSKLHIVAEGTQAQQVITALCELIGNRFGELE